MAEKGIDLELLLRTPMVEAEVGFDLSPDGRFVAFSWNRTGRWEIYQLSLEQPQQVQRVGEGEGARFAPRYSPDGRYLAYLVDADGSERLDLWVCDLKSGQSANLTPHTEFSLQPHYCWSPDGRYIACLSDQQGQFGTYLLEVEGLTVREALVGKAPLWQGAGPHADVCWSPDGRWLAITSEGPGQEYRTHLLPVQQGRAAGEPLPLMWKGHPLNAREVCWSPDGRRLAFSCDERGRYDIALYTVENGEITWLTESRGDSGVPDWSPDGKGLVYVLADGPETWLAVRNLEDPFPQLYQVQPGVHLLPRFTPDGKRVVFIFDNPCMPDDLWLLDLTSGKMQQLTQSLPAPLQGAPFVMPQHITYPSFDGQAVPALLYLPTTVPAGEGLPPAVIVIHGGPTWLFQYLWYPLMTHMVSRGWVVLAPNYRGSSGYGRAWQLANRFEMGRADVMDVVAGADYLVRNQLADARRIAVTGRSHGGYLTMCCLTFYPERFVGGSAVVPFLNWFTSHAASRPDLQHWDIENMGDPRQNASLWRERSPFFFLDRIQAPVQMICGAHDPRCPAAEALAAEQVLRALGREVELLLYPDEGHAFLKIENVVDHEVRRVAFLSRILEG